jgi:hypothetical protein
VGFNARRRRLIFLFKDKIFATTSGEEMKLNYTSDRILKKYTSQWSHLAHELRSKTR